MNTARISASFLSKKFNGLLHKRGISVTVSDLGGTISIEPCTRGRKNLEGMQILYFNDSKTFEVSEYQAGEKEDQLWIYGEYKSIKAAIRSMVKGNKRTPIKIWD